MKSNQLITINQNAKSTLIKSKNLLDTTKTILNNKNYIKYQFWISATFTRVEHCAINSQKAIILYCENIFLERRALLCLITRNCNLKNKILFILDSELLYKILKEKFADKEIIICKSKDINQDFSLFDEIVILYDINLENLLDMKSKNKNISFFTNKKEYIHYFPDNNIFQLDELSLPPFEIFDFARQFVSDNLLWNNKDFLNRLKQKNSGADYPIVYEVNSFEEEIEIIINGIIKTNPINNILILLPFGKDENNFDLSVEKYYQILQKNTSVTKYYSGVTIFNLSNIIITTFDDIKYIDCDIMVIPKFNIIKEIVDNVKIFISICSAKNQLHLI